MCVLNEQGAPEPLSKLTLASLEDIGYVVDPGTVSTASDGTFCKRYIHGEGRPLVAIRGTISKYRAV